MLFCLLAGWGITGSSPGFYKGLPGCDELSLLSGSLIGYIFDIDPSFVERLSPVETGEIFLWIKLHIMLDDRKDFSS